MAKKKSGSRKKAAKGLAAVTKAKSARDKAATISKKARQAGLLDALGSVGTQRLVATVSGQRKAAAAVKANRLAMKGMSTRRAGHSQAQTGRSQARRDQRNASR